MRSDCERRGGARWGAPCWSTVPHAENISKLLCNSWRGRFIPLYIHRYISGRYTAEFLLRSRDFKRRLSRAKHKSPTLSLLLCVTMAKIGSLCLSLVFQRRFSYSCYLREMPVSAVSGKKKKKKNSKRSSSRPFPSVEEWLPLHKTIAFRFHSPCSETLRHCRRVCIIRLKHKGERN